MTLTMRGLGAAVLFGAAALVAPPEFLGHLTVFLLACIVGLVTALQAFVPPFTLMVPK